MDTNDEIRKAMGLFPPESEAYLALNKAIPVKPEIFNSHWHRCPICKTYSGGLKTPYCHSCGQALDWEGIYD